ncbi:MAG: glutamate--tRNA ligase family protein [Candidatus Carsonella ruddii]
MINKITKNIIKNFRNRFAPDPNGFLHFGHLYNIYINFNTSCFKNDFFLIRFDNTNLSNFNLYYYYFLLFDVLWLGIKWNKKKFFLNDYFYFIIIFLFFNKNKKIIFKKKIIILRIFFNYYNYNKIIKLFIFKNNFYKKKFIYIIKKKIILRKKNKKNNINIFFTYDFTQSINDFLNKIHFSICTKEFIKNSLLYNYIIKKIKKKPFQIEFEKKNYFNNKLSKRKLKKKYYFNLFYLRKLNFTIKKILYICNLTGISKNISYIKNINFKKSILLEKKFLINFILNTKIFINNINKKILFFIFLNKKNINLKYNIIFFKKKIKINFKNFININFCFLILKKIFLIKKIIIKKKIFIIKIIKKKK